MRRGFVLALATVALTPVAAMAQEDRPVSVMCGEDDCELGLERDRELRARADALRATLECPSDVDWPPLPAEGRTVVQTGQRHRTDVTVPQYAYYYFPGHHGDPVCLPVILVQAQGSTFGWTSVLDRPPALGGSFEHFFDLLGTEPPVAYGQSSGPPAPPQMPEVAPEVTDVVTGGYWEAGEMGGRYRLVVWRDDSDKMGTLHHLQWIATPRDGAAPTVLASIPVSELDAPLRTSRTGFESRGGAPVFIVEQASEAHPDGERVVEVHPGVPGEYRLYVVRQTREL